MSLMARDTGSGRDFEPVAQGVYQAVFAGLWDLGTHIDKKFGGERRQIYIWWQFPTERIEYEKDGQTVNAPKVIGKLYTLSLNEKANLRIDLVSVRGKDFSDSELAGFDLKAVLGANCQIQVISEDKDGKIRGKMASIMALPKDVPLIAIEGETHWFSLDERADIPESTPKWIREKIRQSKEWIAENDPNRVIPVSLTDHSRGDTSDIYGETPPVQEEDLPF